MTTTARTANRAKNGIQISGMIAMPIPSRPARTSKTPRVAAIPAKAPAAAAGSARMPDTNPPMALAVPRAAATIKIMPMMTAVRPARNSSGTKIAPTMRRIPPRRSPSPRVGRASTRSVMTAVAMPARAEKPREATTATAGMTTTVKRETVTPMRKRSLFHMVLARMALMPRCREGPMKGSWPRYHCMLSQNQSM